MLQTLVQLYRRPIKIFFNQSTSLEGGLTLVEDKLKEQVAGLELETMFVLCGNLALHTHIPNISVFAHQDQRMEVATGKFSEQPAGADVTKLETSMSFLQIKASIGLQEKIQKVRHDICQNRRETAHVRLEAIAGADSPLQPAAGVWQGPCDHQEWSSGVRDPVQPCGSAAQHQPQLH